MLWEGKSNSLKGSTHAVHFHNPVFGAKIEKDGTMQLKEIGLPLIGQQKIVASTQAHARQQAFK